MRRVAKRQGAVFFLSSPLLTGEMANQPTSFAFVAFIIGKASRSLVGDSFRELCYGTLLGNFTDEFADEGRLLSTEDFC
jgi:hypothetical protein